MQDAADEEQCRPRRGRIGSDDRMNTRPEEEVIQYRGCTFEIVFVLLRAASILTLGSKQVV